MLDTLDEQDRAMLVLKYSQEYSYEELAEVFNLSVSACKMRVSRARDELQRRFRSANVLTNRLFVSDGKITTSAGIASGIDMALALIDRAHGPLVATEVAREMVIYIRRDGSESQQSIYLDYRTHLHPGIHKVQDVLVHDPARGYTLPELASLAGMSRRPTAI